MNVSWIGDSSFIAVQALGGLTSAMFLFAVAAGLSLIFGVTRIVNFSHGSLYMLGAYLSFSVVRRIAAEGVDLWQFVAMLVLAPLMVALIAGVIEVALLKRIYASDEVFQLLLTYAIVLVLADAAKAIWGTHPMSMPRPGILQGSISVFGQPFPTYSAVIAAVGPLIALGLWLLLYRTRWGMFIRAAAEDREMLGALGANEGRLFTGVFVLGGWLAGLAGALAAPMVTVEPGMDVSVIVEAFVVVVVGGLGNVWGSLLAALLIGQFKAFGTLIFPGIGLMAVYVVMAVVLIVRPWGLLGTPEQ